MLFFAIFTILTTFISENNCIFITHIQLLISKYYKQNIYIMSCKSYRK